METIDNKVNGVNGDASHSNGLHKNEINNSLYNSLPRELVEPLKSYKLNGYHLAIELTKMNSTNGNYKNGSGFQKKEDGHPLNNVPKETLLNALNAYK